MRSADLLAAYPASRRPNWNPANPVDEGKRNTTISLVVTNQKLDRAQLERLATQVHASMARALQPIGTEFDGDVLYAVSTAELERPVDESDVPNIDLDVIASEVMWDAILSSVPEQPTIPAPATGLALDSAALARLAGEYVFSPLVRVRVTADGSRLFAQATAERKAFAIPREVAVELLPVTPTAFTMPGRYPLLLEFAERDRLVINPGHWQQTGTRRRD